MLDSVQFCQSNNGTLPQSVLYSIAAPIGGHGLGTDALETLRGLHRHRILGRAIAYGNLQHDIPPSFIRTLQHHPVRLLGLAKAGLIESKKGAKPFAGLRAFG